jgi:hypothetical protein
MHGLRGVWAIGLAAVAVSCSTGDSIPTADPGGACGGVAGCDDADPCTVDTCVNGQCRHAAKSCDDGNDCTTDACRDGACVHEATPGCCRKDADCDDKDLCTTDTCTSDGCRHMRPDASCCVNQDECDDKDDCTIDECVENRCRNTWMKSSLCCKTDGDCADGLPCTDDKCVAGKCSNKSTVCCTIDDECDDDNPCRIWRCEKQTCAYDLVPGCCQVDKDCDDKNACTLDTCDGGDCEHAKTTACCTKDADCLPADPCVAATCVVAEGETKGDCIEKLKDTPDCCSATLLDVAFDAGGLGGFAVEDLYPDTPGPVWVVDSARAASPPSSLYFGDPATHKYDGGSNPVGAQAVSPEIDLTRTMAPRLTFNLWKETELTASQDVVSIGLVAGGTPTLVWSSAVQGIASTGGDFLKVTVDLAPYQAKGKVRLAIRFDTLNAFANGYEGAYLDDVKVEGTCGE